MMNSSSEVIVGSLFKTSTTFEVPLYQRHYVWDSINWGHLWEDIEEKSDLRANNNSPKEHFTGAIVIREISAEERVEIIDGQQRLTTFQIILCAIRDICEKHELQEGKTADKYIHLQSVALTNTDIKCKLLPRAGTDRDVFVSLVERNHEKVDRNNLIWEAYEYFRNNIQKYVTDDSGNFDYTKLSHLYDSIVKDFRIIKIIANSDYAKIFKSINGTGRHLAQFDLLRNDLFLRAEGIDRDELYTNYWQHFEEDPNWRKNKNKVLDDFLENFLKIKLGADFDEEFSLFDLYELYCQKLTKELNCTETDPQLVKHEFYDLKRYSKVYHELHLTNSEKISGQIKFYEEFNDKLDVVEQLKLFIFYITNEFGVSSREFNRVLNLFESYVLRGILYIGSNRSKSPALRALNNSLIRALDRKRSLSIVSLVHSLSSRWTTDQEVKFALGSLPKTDGRRRKSESDLMREFGGSYIFDVLGWEIDHETELFDRFCEKWPSAEALLQEELIGDLPIVYSRIPVSMETIGSLGFDSENHAFEQAKPQLENYVFVTYRDMKEFSEYETDENSLRGIEVNSEQYKTVTMDLTELLFAFPTIVMSNIQTHIQDDVKNKRLQPVSRQDAFPTENWLFDEIADLQTRVKRSASEHWLLPNTEVIVVTRAGHELQGKLQSFNNNAIYMEINEHIVTVYRHGIYELKRKTHSKRKAGQRRRGRLA